MPVVVLWPRRLLLSNTPQQWRNCGAQRSWCTLNGRPPGASGARCVGRAGTTVATAHWASGRHFALVRRFFRRMRWRFYCPLLRWRRRLWRKMCGSMVVVGGRCDDVVGINVAPPRLPAIAGGARPPLTGRRCNWRNRRQRTARRVPRTTGQCDDQFPWAGVVAMFAQPNALPGAEGEFAFADRYR